MCTRVLAFVLILLATPLFAANSEPGLSAELKAAVAALPAESAPLETRSSRNGSVYFLLPNGCEIIIKEKRNAPVVAVQAWVRTGAIHEGPWMGAGLSHFCEHMLFKGTTKRPTSTLDTEIRGSGGDNNAYTTQDRTVYHITTESSGFDTAFDAIADMLMDSTFPAEETTKEHAVVVKEIERYQDSPDGALWEAFERTMFSTHPYGVPVLGYPDRFKRVTREEVFSYYKARYTPQLSTFLVVGDVSAAKILPQMVKTLVVWRRISVEPVAIPTEPPQVAPRSLRITHSACEVPKFILGFPSVSMRDDDVYALDLLSTIAGDGRTSRLYLELKEKQQLALDVSSFNYTPLYPGYFVVAAQAEGETMEAAKKTALGVLESFKTVPPSGEELARAKRKVRAQHIKGQMTAEGLAERIGSDWLVCGDLDFSERYIERLERVSAEDIMRVANKYFLAHRVNEVSIWPKGEPENPKAALDAEETTVKVGNRKRWMENQFASQLDSLRKNAAVTDVQLDAQNSLFTFTLKPSGVRVIVRDDPALPIVQLTLALLGGTRWEPAEKSGASNMLAKMMERGTAERDARRVALDVEDLGAELSTFSGRNALGLQLEGLSENAEKLLQIASECLLQPRFDAVEFDKVRSDVLQEIQQEDESLFALNAKILRPLVYGRHPYARPLLGTAESVKKLSIDDLKSLHATWMQPANVAVCVVGDLRAADVAKMLTPRLAHLQPARLQIPEVPPPQPPAAAQSGEDQRPGLSGAVLTVGYPGAGIKSPDRDALDVITAILSGMGGRLNTELREKQGLAYAVGAHNESHIDGGMLMLFVQTDPQGLEKSYASMLSEAQKLRLTAVATEELKSVRNYLTGTEAIALQNQRDLCQRLALAVLYGEDPTSVFTRRTRLETLTPAQIQASAQKYLSPETLSKAVVKPQ